MAIETMIDVHGVLDRAPASLACPFRERIDAVDWRQVEIALAEDGYAVIPSLLADQDGQHVANLYGEEDRFRSRIVMERHAFGRGEYKYFSYPLPDAIGRLRPTLYSRLA